MKAKYSGREFRNEIMPYTPKVPYKVFIASPGDVVKYRKRAKKVFKEKNSNYQKAHAGEFLFNTFFGKKMFHLVFMEVARNSRAKFSTNLGNIVMFLY